jgi:hypothetical protein
MSSQERCSRALSAEVFVGASAVVVWWSDLMRLMLTPALHM